ncbi:hypothetical protein [Streptomyces sp. 8N706]|uniref:hypothetical protein n=1 Tax=Streptomyces sp. 8N706 TaxID=3457416 RepID=UPI003FD5CBD7
MSPDIGSRRGPETADSGGSQLRIAGGLMVVGLLLNAVVTAVFHPSGEEDDHQAIFTEYADSGAWVAVHLGQFVGVLTALGVLFFTAPCEVPAGLLCRRISRPRRPLQPLRSGPFCRALTAWG